MADWSKLPDLGTVVLLAWAFATVARRNPSPVSNYWLTGWIFIAAHFAASFLAPLPGLVGLSANFIGDSSLALAGLLFFSASIPYRAEESSRRMFFVLTTTNILYLGALSFFPNAKWAFIPLAILIGLLPAVVALTSRPVIHFLRGTTVYLYAALGCFLLITQFAFGASADLCLKAILFTVYLGCCIAFLHTFRNRASGAFLSTSGFLAWSLVFVIGPLQQTYFPAFHIESEVWNLPKYIVAVGMILVVLEQQIEHNKHLALHDELTGLPNRRLFQDRLNLALERARRTNSQTALLLIDLDNFKKVNDTGGHHAGDIALRQVAQILGGRVRRSDTVARTGGDEFSVILEEPITREDADRVRQSLIELLHKPFQIDGISYQLGASIGVSLYPSDAPSAEQLQIHADQRMYKSKRDGRNTTRDPALAPESSVKNNTEFSI